MPASSALRRLPIVLGVVLALLVVPACSEGVEGTYRDATGMMVLEFRSGGEVRQQVMGMTTAGTYEVEGDEVIVDIGGRRMVLQHTDGRLENGPVSLTRQE
jgi:hypothetical protein